MIGSASYLFSHFRLMFRVVRNEWRTQYAGSSLGILWTLLKPWMLLSLYSVIYVFIFRIRAEGMTTPQYVLYVFSGLIPFFMTAESLSQGVGSVTSSKAVIENKIFPVDLVPPKAIFIGQSPMIAGMPVVIIGSLWMGSGSWTMLALPVLWCFHILALMGILWIMSLINVVFRDLQNFVQIMLITLLIASPFSYTPDMVPARLQPIIALNPFAYFVMAYQGILVRGHLPPIFNCIFILVFSLGLFFLGSKFFSRAKRVIIDYV